MKKTTKKYDILWKNLVIFLVYNILIYLYARGDSLILVACLFYSNIIAITINVICGAKYKKEDKEKARMYFISAGLIALIGFSACLSIGELV